MPRQLWAVEITAIALGGLPITTAPVIASEDLDSQHVVFPRYMTVDLLTSELLPPPAGADSLYYYRSWTITSLGRWLAAYRGPTSHLQLLSPGSHQSSPGADITSPEVG